MIIRPAKWIVLKATLLFLNCQQLLKYVLTSIHGGMFRFAKNSTSKVINSLFFMFLQEVHAALSLQENQSIHDLTLERVKAKVITKLLQASQ